MGIAELDILGIFYFLLLAAAMNIQNQNNKLQIALLSFYWSAFFKMELLNQNV